MAGAQTVHGAGPGSVIADRYRLESTATTGARYPTTAGVTSWTADDVRAGAKVRLWILPASSPLADDLLDAARRARAVTLPGLVAVLDAGRDDASAWVALSEPPGRSLRRILEGQPLPPETARRVIGEAARTLARCGARGVHHTRLSPESVHVTDDGEVLISGLAVDAARVGDHLTGDEARRADAVGLVRLLHAALTGRWHGPASLAAGLPQAPRLSGAVVGPADLVGGVPNDLDTLCRVTLGAHEDGPLTPQELADQLAPWAPAVPVATAGALDATGPCRPVTAPIAGSVAVPVAAPEPASGRDVEGVEVPVADLREPVPDGEITRPRPVLVDLDAAASDRSAALAAATLPRAAVNGAASAAVHGAAAGPTPAGATPAGPHRPDQPPATPRDAAGETVVVDRIPASFLPSTSAATLWEWSRTPINGVPIQDQGPVAQLPGVDPLVVSPPDQRASRVVLGLMVGLVLIGTIIGVLAVRGLTHAGFGLFDDKPSLDLPPLTSGKPAASQPAALPPATITKAIALDPQGDDQENDADAGKAIDGSGSSQWRSDRYRSSDFGGLKDGLGLALQLSKGQVRGLVVKVDGDGGRVELRAANGPGLDGSTVVATSAIDGGTATLIPARPVTSPYLVLWFTRAPRVDGGYRVEVSDVQVR